MLVKSHWAGWLGLHCLLDVTVHALVLYCQQHSNCGARGGAMDMTLTAKLWIR
jgi:hypothetical protein